LLCCAIVGAVAALRVARTLLFDDDPGERDVNVRRGL